MRKTCYIYGEGLILKISEVHIYVQVICTTPADLYQAGSVSLLLLFSIHELQLVWENHSFLLRLFQGKGIYFPSVDKLC